MLLLCILVLLALLPARKRKPEKLQPKLRGRVVPSWKTCSCLAVTHLLSPRWLPPTPSYLGEKWFVRSDVLGTWTMILLKRWITGVWRCGNFWLEIMDFWLHSVTCPTGCHRTHPAAQQLCRVPWGPSSPHRLKCPLSLSPSKNKDSRSKSGVFIRRLLVHTSLYEAIMLRHQTSK